MAECNSCLLDKPNKDFTISQKTNFRNVDCKKCVRKQYNKDNAEYKLAYAKIQNKIYREKEADKIAEYNLKNKDLQNLKSRKYYKKHKAERALYWQSGIGKLNALKNSKKRKELKLKIFETYTSDDILFTQQLFNNTCFNCGSIKNLAIDHHMPLTMGYGLTKTNAVVLCKSCNSKKYNKHPRIFYSDVQIEILEEVYNIKTKEIL